MICVYGFCVSVAVCVFFKLYLLPLPLAYIEEIYGDIFSTSFCGGLLCLVSAPFQYHTAKFDAVYFPLT